MSNILPRSRIRNLISNVSFTNPKKSNVVILYQQDYSIKEYILKDIPSTTLDPNLDNLKIIFTPKIIFRMIARMRLIDWKNYKRNYFLYDISRQIYFQYILAIIDYVGAKIVITIIDNSNIFQKLSRLDKRRTYFAIQNGTRTLACVRDSLTTRCSVISMTNFFCFGDRDVSLFSSHGHKIDSYYSVGSLVSSYYKNAISIPVENQKFDLCLISQWHDHFFSENDNEDFSSDVARRVRIGIEGLNLFLLRLLSDTGLSLVICTRNDSDVAERTYYKNIFGKQAQIIESDCKNFSTYRTVEQSRLTIALNSTVLAEVFAWNKKVLWCNVQEDEHYEMPEAGISYFHGDDYSAFKEQVWMLLNMSQKGYEEQTRESARYINNYDTANPPHEIIRSAVIETLSNTNMT